MLWVIDWLGDRSRGPTRRPSLDYALDHRPLRRLLASGVLDTKHVVYYVSFIAFGLFLTARSVDTERWRG